MKTREEQIEEMAKAMCEEYDTDICKHECPMATDCANILIAKRLIAAGYRKQSEVAKEFVDRLILELIALRSEEFDGKELAINGKTYKYLVMRAKEIAAEYGVEVEE
jgi:hypothetical protein